MAKEKPIKKEKMFLTIALVLLVVSLFSFFLVLLENKPLLKKEIQTSVIVGEKTGFDLDNSSLSFGKVIPGNGVSREIEIKNNYNFPIYTQIIIKGNISRFLNVKPQIINPDKTKKLKFNLNIPEDIVNNTYKGKVIILLKEDK